MKHYLWALRPYFRQVAGELLLGSIAGLLMNALVVLPAILLGRAIDAVLAFERGEVPAAAVGWAGLALVGGTLATEVPRLGKRWWLITANARIRANLRADALRGVLAWPLARAQSLPIGDLMARIMGDVETLGTGVREFIIETWDTLLFSLALVVALLLYDPGLTLLALWPAPLAMMLAQLAGRWVRARTTAARAVNGALTTAIQENLAGLRVLRLFGRAGQAVTRVAALSGQQAEANLASVRLREGLKPVYSTLMLAGVVLVIWQGGQRVTGGALTVGAFIAYLELYLRFTGRAHRIPQMINSIQAGGAAYARLAPLLAPALPVAAEPGRASFQPGWVAGLNLPPALPAAPTGGPLAIALDGVTLRSPGAAQPVLRDLSLELPAGALVVVTGPIGAGKSALARALVGLWPLEAGTLKLDGRPLVDWPAVERAARVGYLPQDPRLFSGTLRENLLLGAAGDDEVIAGVLRTAQLEADLCQWPDGLATPMGEQGLRVSGGQRQRLALARALVPTGEHGRGLLVLDDPFSAVDVPTEAALVLGLRAAYGPDAPRSRQATVVVVTQRLAIGAQADRVIVLDAGRVVEQGTHAGLLAAGGRYAHIFHLQSQAIQAEAGPI